MYFEFTCAKCGKKLRLREEYAGKKARCPHCHHTQVVEAPGADNPLEFLQEVSAPARAGGAPSAAPSARKPQPRAPREEAVSGTEVSVLKSGLIGLAVFVAIYAVFFPFRHTYLGALLWNRGWVQFAEIFLAAWSGAILVMKTRKLATQRDSMLFDLLPSDIAAEIDAETCGRFIAHIRGLPLAAKESFLVNRVLRGLEHFGVSRSSSEVAGRLASQSEIDSNAVDSSYTLVKVFVWAIPILGFIGTVIGIGQAVGSFSATMSAAADLSALKDSFNTVTAGLATAFDTTLLALVLSIFIMFPMSSLQKGEQDLLNWVDEYCNENLLKRLTEYGGPMPAGTDGRSLQAAVDAAMASHHAELRVWIKKLEALGENLSQQMIKGWTQADEQIRNRHTQLLRDVNKAVESIHEINERLKATSEKQTATMTDLAQRTAEVQTSVGTSMKQSAEAMQRAAESVQGYFTALGQGIGSLNEVLGKIGQKQVVVQLPPRRRRWWFGRRDGG